MNDLSRARASLFRAGTSKGLFFLGDDLPTDLLSRNEFLLAALGSPDPRQIDGVGGAHPLTSKIAIVSPSKRESIDVDYLFLQVWPERTEVSDKQNCGNILAAVAPFAIEEGLISVQGEMTTVRIWMENTASVAYATVATPKGKVKYSGSSRIDGVPGGHQAIDIEFRDIEGSSCGSLLPTGNVVDVIDGFEVTCTDNGMPVVCVNAKDLGVVGDESPHELEEMENLVKRVESLRLRAGHMMNLGDVTTKSVPKVSILSPARQGGVLATRTFIPHRVHEAIGVLGAVSVASACLIQGSVASKIASIDLEASTLALNIEHPSGYFTVNCDLERGQGGVKVSRVSLMRTARLLMRGEVYVSSQLENLR